MLYLQDESREEEALWRELTVEKITSAVDAALTALYIMTSSNMPKQVYLEDVIERLVMMTKMQLSNTIFPEFDPVYRIDPKNKRKGPSIIYFNIFTSIVCTKYMLEKRGEV